MAAAQHIVVRFSRSGVNAAYDFQHFLQSLNLTAAVEYTAVAGWMVRTDTRIFAHAAAVEVWMREHRADRKRGAA